MIKSLFSLPLIAGFLAGNLFAAAAFADQIVSDGPTGQAASDASDRVLFIDPETGERRAPTAREAEALQNQLQHSVEKAPLQAIQRPDGSTMVYMNQRVRSVLQLEVRPSGDNAISHATASKRGGQE